MRRCAWLWLGWLILVTAGCSVFQQGSPGLVVYQVWDKDSQLPKPQLAVTDMNGSELRRISGLSSADVDFVIAGLSSQVSQRTLILTSGEKIYWVDAAKGIAQRLDVKSGVMLNAAQFRFSGGKRYALLGNARMDLAYLVNLETGKVNDLNAIGQGILIFLNGQFSPSEDYLALFTDAGAWLVPTADPTQSRRLGKEKIFFAASFSSDGKQIAYSQMSGSGKSEVWLEQVNGTGSEVIATGDAFMPLAFVPGQRQVVINRSGRLSLFSLDSRKEEELSSYSGQSRRLWFAPGGQALVFDQETDQKTTWQWLDLKQRQAKTLNDLDGYAALYSNVEHRWLTFVNSLNIGVGHRFVSLDLETGKTQEILAFDKQTISFLPSDFSPDGKFSVIAAQIGNMTQLWLTRADGGKARLLAEVGSAGGAFSPDGRWVAVSTLIRSDGKNQAKVVLMQTDGNETKLLGEGLKAIWVRP
ncbi:MAG: PD40 domain-containing protein [Chloroflexota bacterium]|nr:PD40 domain-containing protein [Chloroflexota bacterium]